MYVGLFIVVVCELWWVYTKLNSGCIFVSSTAVHIYETRVVEKSTEQSSEGYSLLELWTPSEEDEWTVLCTYSMGSDLVSKELSGATNDPTFDYLRPKGSTFPFVLHVEASNKEYLCTETLITKR